MRVALVTTWATACGIAEHSAFLKQAVESADPSIEITPITDLHPHALLSPRPEGDPDLIVLNYHAALLSQWTPDAIRLVQAQRQVPIVVIYHDTGVPNTDQCKQVSYVLRPGVDKMIVHEPFDDLPIQKVEYWRMGIPGWANPWEFSRSLNSWSGPRPILGSIGFPFPWKNYDKLAEITAACGWALCLLAPGAKPDQIAAWERLNPHLLVRGDFVNAQSAVGVLSACDATAFAYTCQNGGQSAAILMGIAARKPVLAFEQCRQFRALKADPLGRLAIHWCDDFAQMQAKLRYGIPIQRVAPAIVALAEQDSWSTLGVKYAHLWRELTEPRPLL